MRDDEATWLETVSILAIWAAGMLLIVCLGVAYFTGRL